MKNNIEDVIKYHNIVNKIHIKNIMSHNFSDSLLNRTIPGVSHCSKCNIPLGPILYFAKIFDETDFTKITCEEIQIKKLLE